MAVALTRTATGKKYGLDDFSTPPYDVVTNNWEFFAGTVAIESGELSFQASGGGTTSSCYSKASYSGDQVICYKARTLTAGSHCFIYWKWSSGNFYYVAAEGTGASVTLRLGKYVSSVHSTLATAAVAWLVDTDYELKIVDIDGIIKVYKDGVLVLEAADTSHSTGKVRPGIYHATADTAHAHFDNVSISSANAATCSNLPTGWKLRAAENNTYKATEVGGTATVDLAGLTLPTSKAEALDAADAVQASYTSTNDVWGGDAFRRDRVEVINETVAIVEVLVRRRVKSSPFTKTAKGSTTWTKASKTQTPWTPELGVS